MQLTRYTGENAHIRNAGIEDLTVSGGGDGNIRFEAAAYSWVKNVETTLWLGEAIGVNNSFRIEIRDSYIHDGVWSYPGGGGYGISLAAAASEVLIENNIVTRMNKVMVVRSSGAGSVVGYNYMDNGFIENAQSWVEVGLNGSHMVGSHHILFEGNESFNYDSDNTHGNAIAMTIFRNHLIGRRRDFPEMGNARGAGVMFGSWWHSFIGNVLGEARGRCPDVLTCDEHGDPVATSGSWATIDPTGNRPRSQGEEHCGPGQQLRLPHQSGAVGSISRLTLPPSLYLRAKPAFFGSNPWPWVDPTGGTKLGVLPARRRFDEALGTTSGPVQGDPSQGNPGKDNPGQGNPDKGNPDKGNPDKGNPDKGNPGKGNAG